MLIDNYLKIGNIYNCFLLELNYDTKIAIISNFKWDGVLHHYRDIHITPSANLLYDKIKIDDLEIDDNFITHPSLDMVIRPQNYIVINFYNTGKVIFMGYNTGNDNDVGNIYAFDENAEPGNQFKDVYIGYAGITAKLLTNYLQVFANATIQRGRINQ